MPLVFYLEVSKGFDLPAVSMAFTAATAAEVMVKIEKRMIFGYCVANQAVLMISIYRKAAIMLVKGPDKMVVILLRGCGVRFRQHSLYEASAANVVDFRCFQP
jgi:hypothetical protein